MKNYPQICEVNENGLIYWCVLINNQSFKCRNKKEAEKAISLINNLCTNTINNDINTLPIQDVMDYAYKLDKLLQPLNSLLFEAYHAGVKELYVFSIKNHPHLGFAPRVYIDMHRRIIE